MDAGRGVYYATGGLDTVLITLTHLGLVKPEQVLPMRQVLTPAQREDAQDETDLYRARGGRAR
jgi:hypothetical protein